MSQVRFRFVLIVLGLFLFAAESVAQDCGCDHTVTADVTSIDGDDLGVLPGEVICIEGGDREFLRFYNLQGSAEAPIVVTNCNGEVNIDNADRGYGLTLSNSAFVHITGTGDPTVNYGFKVRASREGPDYSASCISLAEFSTDFEIDHVEAYDCGFAGVTTKTDPTCEERDLSDFVQRNSRLHHLYLHDTGGEGIYFGSTGFPSRIRNCDGVDVPLIPHSHEGVWIHDNIIEDTGWDGAQVGVSPKDCYVYRNRIARVGLSREEFQMQGLQFGGGSSCDVFDNFLTAGPAIGIIVLDAANMRIYNNVISDFVDGIYVNDRDSEVSEGATYQVLHNTLSSIQDRALGAYGTRSTGNAFVNNLIAAGGTNPLAIGNEVDATTEGNLVLDSVSEALFVDSAEGNYQLLLDSPAIDSGAPISAYDVDTDQLGAERDASPDAGAFEFGAEAPENPVSPPGPGENPSSPTAGEAEDAGEKGGCSCRLATDQDGHQWLVMAIALLLLARGRRALRAQAQSGV